MIRKTGIAFLVFAFTLVSVVAAGHAAFGIGKRLKTELANESEVAGTYTLILYGGRYSSDIETIAILDREGDGYTIEPYAPGFDYTVTKGLSAKEALAAAAQFIRLHASYHRSQLARILDDRGSIVGFELRPLYMPLTFGVIDVLDVDYSLKDGKVTVYIRLVPSAERMLRGDDGLDKIF